MDSSPPRNSFQLLMSVGAALLVFSVLMNLYLLWRNVNLYRETQRKAIQIQRIEADFREWQTFLQEMAEYSKRQPAVDPLLQKYMFKGPAAPAVSPKAK